MLIPVTLEEAFNAALAAANAKPDSAWAVNLKEGEDLGDLLYDSMHDSRGADSPEFIAVCTYFAVRGGAIVMREETCAERMAREDAEVASVYG